MFKAKDLMTTHVVTVSVDDTIDHAIALMVRHRISGLPVVDREGRPAGIVSEFDLLELICEGHTEQATVSQYMSPKLFGVAEEDSWVTVVDVFRETRVRRLPVLRDGRIVGIVTRHDLMRAIRDARQRLRRELPQHIELASRQAHGDTTFAGSGAGCVVNQSESQTDNDALQTRRGWNARRPGNPNYRERTMDESLVYSNFGADPDLGELVELFVQEMPDRISVLETQARSRDWAQLTRTAHQLKGAAGSYGFHDITPFAARLEQAARAGQQEQQILASLDELLDLCRRVRAGAPQVEDDRYAAPRSELGE